MGKLEDHPHHACAVVEQFLSMEESSPDKPMGGSDTQNDRKGKIIETNDPVTIEKANSVDNHNTKETAYTNKCKRKIGAALKERDQLNVLKVLSDNNDRFAYTIEEVDIYTGPLMEIKPNSQKGIFRPPHKLGEK